MRAIETVSPPRRGSLPCLQPRNRLLRAVAAALMTLAAPALGADGPAPQGLARPSVTAPFRFAPPAPHPASPVEDQKAQQYRSQLQQEIFDLDRSGKLLGALQDEELRRARGELDRMNQTLLPRR